MEIPAIGRVAGFGDIYDARIIKFTGINAFQINLDNSYIKSTENPNSSYKFSFANRESEKLDAMDISGELKINILCGLIELGGSAKYIKNDKHSKKCIQCSYILKTTTKKESINWNLKEFSKHFDFDGIEGTHMVVGIQYGGNAVVTLRYTSDEIQNSSEIQGSLKAKLAKITKVTGELSVAGRMNKIKRINEQDLNICVEADVNFEGEDVIKIEGATKFLQTLSSKLQKYNDGKGVQVAFEMVPLEKIFKVLKMQICEDQIYRALDNGLMVEIIREVYELEKTKEELVQHIIKHEVDKEYFTKIEREWLNDEKSKFEAMITNIQINIAKILKLFHDKDPSASKEFKAQSARISKLKKDVYEFNEKSDDLIIKAEFIKKTKSSKVLYICQKKEYDSFKWQNKTLCICLFSEKYYRENLNLLIQFIHDSNSNQSENIYILLDIDILCDFVKSELRMDKTPNNPLLFYVNGKYQVDDDDDDEVIIGISVFGVNFYANYYKNHQFHEFAVEAFILTLNDHFTENLINACRVLNLKVLHILHEPIAVSLTQLISATTPKKKTFCYCNFLGYQATLNTEYDKIDITDYETNDDPDADSDVDVEDLKTALCEVIGSEIEKKLPTFELNETNGFQIIIPHLKPTAEAFLNGEEKVTFEENIDGTLISVSISKEQIEKNFDDNYGDFFENVASMAKENPKSEEIFVVGDFGCVPFIQKKIAQKISRKLSFLPSNTGAKGAAIYGASILGHFKKYTTSFKKKRKTSAKEETEVRKWKKEKISKIETCMNDDGELEKKYIKIIGNGFDVEKEKAEFQKVIKKLNQK